MNPNLEEDLQRWEARTASLDEIEALHPGQDVRGLAELHVRLGLLTQEATPDPQAGWELLQNRLPEKAPSYVHIDQPERRRRYPRTRRRVAILALAAALVLTSGLVVAGALPAPAQNAIANVAGRLGFDLPHASEPSDVTSRGEEVSNFAHSTDAEGCEKGKAVSALASALAKDHRRNPADTPHPCQKTGTGDRSGASVAPGSTAPAGSNVGSDAASAHRQGDGSEPAGADGSASNSYTAPKGNANPERGRTLGSREAAANTSAAMAPAQVNPPSRHRSKQAARPIAAVVTHVGSVGPTDRSRGCSPGATLAIRRLCST